MSTLRMERDMNLIAEPACELHKHLMKPRYFITKYIQDLENDIYNNNSN